MKFYFYENIKKLYLFKEEKIFCILAFVFLHETFYSILFPGISKKTGFHDCY